jgi:hypothetical protein
MFFRVGICRPYASSTDDDQRFQEETQGEGKVYSKEVGAEEGGMRGVR